MNEKDFHGECAHCLETPPPMWPISDINEWKMELCHAEAKSENAERTAKIQVKDKIVSAELRAQQKKDSEQKKRDRKDQHMRTMREAKERRLGLLNINYGGITIMARKNKTDEGTSETVVAEKKERVLTKTGLLDSLIGADIEGSYAEGAKEGIVAQVAAAFPSEDVKRLGGLYFSRRAVLKAQAAKMAETATA